MFFRKPHIVKIESKLHHLNAELEQAMQHKDFSHFTFKQQKDYWTFQMQPKGIRPFGNNGAALNIYIKALDDHKLELNIQEAQAYLLPALLLIMLFVGLFYGLFLSNYLPFIGILVGSSLLYFYNASLQKSLRTKFLSLLEKLDLELE